MLCGRLHLDGRVGSFLTELRASYTCYNLRGTLPDPGIRNRGRLWWSSRLDLSRNCESGLCLDISKGRISAARPRKENVIDVLPCSIGLRIAQIGWFVLPLTK